MGDGNSEVAVVEKESEYPAGLPDEIKNLPEDGGVASKYPLGYLKPNDSTGEGKGYAIHSKKGCIEMWKQMGGTFILRGEGPKEEEMNILETEKSKWKKILDPTEWAGFPQRVVQQLVTKK